MHGRDCDELRMAWALTYFFPVIATPDGFPRDFELLTTATVRGGSTER